MKVPQMLQLVNAFRAAGVSHHSRDSPYLPDGSNLMFAVKMIEEV